MEVMRTVYSPNPIPTLFSDVEMAVIVPETEEIAFTLVTNKKSKRKAKAFSLLSTDSRNKILLVSRALSPKTVTASTAATISKPAHWLL